MRIAVAILFFVGVFSLPGGQQSTSTTPTRPSSFGLAVGQQAPAFTLSDQFGQEQSNETLKGPNGTILLFFRSADW